MHYKNQPTETAVSQLETRVAYIEIVYFLTLLKC